MRVCVCVCMHVCMCVCIRVCMRARGKPFRTCRLESLPPFSLHQAAQPCHVPASHSPRASTHPLLLKLALLQRPRHGLGGLLEHAVRKVLEAIHCGPASQEVWGRCPLQSVCRGSGSDSVKVTAKAALLPPHPTPPLLGACVVVQRRWRYIRAICSP